MGQLLQEIFFKGHCQVLLIQCPDGAWVPTLCWCWVLRKRSFDTYQNFSEFMFWERWLATSCVCGVPAAVLLLRWGIPIRREAIFYCNKHPSQNTCFVFWILPPAFSMTFLKTWHLPLLLFPSHPPCVCCLFFIILPSKGILNSFIISKPWFVCVCAQIFSTSISSKRLLKKPTSCSL